MRKSGLWLFILICLFGFFGLRPILATDYYVATNGNDSNSGTLASPFKTIQKAVDKVTSGGDRVLVLPGEYITTSTADYSPNFYVRNKHGSFDNNIIIKAYDINNRPVVVGNQSGISIITSSYITIEGFEVKNSVRAGIAMSLSDNITIRNNRVYHGFTGMCTGNEPASDPYYGCGKGWPKGRVYKDGTPRKYNVSSEWSQVTPGVYLCKTINSVIEENLIENVDEGVYIGASRNVNSYSRSGSEEDLCYEDPSTIPDSLETRVWNENNIIRNNYIDNAIGEGIEFKPDTRNNIFENNIVKDENSFAGSAVEIRGHSNTIRNNIIVNSAKVAIRILASESSNGSYCNNTPDNGSFPVFSNGNKKCSFSNTIERNIVFYWGQNENSTSAITVINSDSDIVRHNTVAGYSKSSSYLLNIYSKNSTITDNLFVDQTTSASGWDFIYDSPVSDGSWPRPNVSDYNAYYPNKRGSTCVVKFGGGFSIVCEDLNGTNQSNGFEYHSKFLTSYPFETSINECSVAIFESTNIKDLRAKVENCSKPKTGSVIINAASDGKNIGALDSTSGVTPTPTNTPTPVSPTPTISNGSCKQGCISGDVNCDGKVDVNDLYRWYTEYRKVNKIFPNESDLDCDGDVDIYDGLLCYMGYRYGK